MVFWNASEFLLLFDLKKVLMISLYWAHYMSSEVMCLLQKLLFAWVILGKGAVAYSLYASPAKGL